MIAGTNHYAIKVKGLVYVPEHGSPVHPSLDQLFHETREDETKGTIDFAVVDEHGYRTYQPRDPAGQSFISADVADWETRLAVNHINRFTGRQSRVLPPLAIAKYDLTHNITGDKLAAVAVISYNPHDYRLTEMMRSGDPLGQVHLDSLGQAAMALWSFHSGADRGIGEYGLGHRYASTGNIPLSSRGPRSTKIPPMYITDLEDAFELGRLATPAQVAGHLADDLTSLIISSVSDIIARPMFVDEKEPKEPFPLAATIVSKYFSRIPAQPGGALRAAKEFDELFKAKQFQSMFDTEPKMYEAFRKALEPTAAKMLASFRKNQRN